MGGFLFLRSLGIYTTDKTVSPFVLVRMLKFVYISFTLPCTQPVGCQAFHHIII